MAELKTKPTDDSVEDYINQIPDPNKRRDASIIVEMMRKATQAEPQMWGTSIVGFGNHHYKYASGRELDWFVVGFSARKQNLTLYLHADFEHNTDLINKLGKHKTGNACLYINRLDDIHQPTLQALIELSVRNLTNPESKIEG